MQGEIVMAEGTVLGHICPVEREKTTLKLFYDYPILHLLQQENEYEKNKCRSNKSS